MGDSGVAILAGFPSLESLDLRGTDITDEGLRRLKALKSLKILNVEDTKVTEKGLAELSAALPDLEVYRTQAKIDAPQGVP